ncbi:hypothetical protein [Marinobacterium sp. MBR-109]|jgi:hypothetical protein|uniref:hypothetical protein n=1 Tax=Marinobacterium sp. MBR-109 TaxID=3156462 RepID=UPI003391DE4E
MRKLGAGVFVLVLMVAAAYGFYWYQVKSQADDLVQQMSPFAQVRYGSVYAHPDGTVGVDGLTITPHQMHAPVSIEAVRIQAGSPLFFLFGSDTPPERLNISLKQVRQGLDSELFRTVQQQSDLMLESNPLYVSPNALGCGSVRQFDINTMKRMGFSEMLMDINMDYRGDSRARKIHFDLFVDIHDLGETRMEMALSADPNQLRNPMIASGNARLETLSFNYADRGYNQRRDRFCAAEAGIKPAEYRQQHRHLFVQWLNASGVELPDSLLAAYFDLQQPDADMAFSLRPVGGVGAAEVMMQDPMTLLQSLNLQFSINDKPLVLDGIDWSELMTGLAMAGNPGRTDSVSAAEPEEGMVAAASEAEAEASAGSEASQVAESVAAAEQRVRAQPVSKRYQPTPLAELPAYLGAPVRIFTYFGNDVEGQLVHADGQGIRVMQRLKQGVAEYPLDNDRIQQAEVWR